MAAKKKAKKKTAAKRNALRDPRRRKKVARRVGPSPANEKAFLPGKLVTHDDGKYSLIYTDFVHGEVFEKRGLEGGGYTWHGLVDHLLRTDAPKALRHLDFDPEASMFAVMSKDLSALHAAAKALAKLQDKALLEKLAASVDLSEFD